MNEGNLQMALCLLLLVLTIFYVWDTPKKKRRGCSTGAWRFRGRSFEASDPEV